MDTDQELRHDIANILHPLLLTTKAIELMIERDQKEDALNTIRQYLLPTLERAAKVLQKTPGREIVGQP